MRYPMTFSERLRAWCVVGAVFALLCFDIFNIANALFLGRMAGGRGGPRWVSVGDRPVFFGFEFATSVLFLVGLSFVLPLIVQTALGLRPNKWMSRKGDQR